MWSQTADIIGLSRRLVPGRSFSRFHSLAKRPSLAGVRLVRLDNDGGLVNEPLRLFHSLKVRPRLETWSQPTGFRVPLRECHSLDDRQHWLEGLKNHSLQLAGRSGQGQVNSF
jgi:hypothetical protein